MTLQDLAENTNHQDLLRIERLIDIEILKRRIDYHDPDLKLAILTLRRKVMDVWQFVGFDTSLGECDDYIDSTLDFLQFGAEHGKSMILGFSETDGLQYYSDKINEIYKKISKKANAEVKKIIQNSSFPTSYRLAEISYVNDLKLGYSWWLGAQGKIIEPNTSGNIILNEDLKNRWNAIRSGASLIEIPCRIPRIKSGIRGDYHIQVEDVKIDDQEHRHSDRFEIQINMNWNADFDSMALDLIKELRLAWSFRSWGMLNKGILDDKNRGGLIINSNTITKQLEKNITKLSIKKDHVGPFFLGVICWDAMQRHKKMKDAIDETTTIHQEITGETPDYKMHDSIKRNYNNIGRRIRKNSSKDT